MIEAGPILLVDAGLSAPEPDAPQVALALAEAGYMVQSADVARAVEAVRANHPALVVLDADAPGAMALLATLRRMDETARTPILLVGHPGKTVQSARDAILRGADAFYPRPIDARRVLLKVETYLGLPDDAPGAPPPPLASKRVTADMPVPNPTLPFEREPGATDAGVRPEPTFVLNDAAAGSDPGEKRSRTLPPPIPHTDPGPGAQTEARSVTSPLLGAPPPQESPPRPSFDAGLSEELRGVLRSMERKLFPDAPPLVVPELEDEGDELVPSDLLEGLGLGEDEAEEEPRPDPEPAAAPPAEPAPIVETLDLRAPTTAVLPPEEPTRAIASVPPSVPALPTRDEPIRGLRRDSIPPAPPPDVLEERGPRLSIHGRSAASGDLGREDPVQVFAAALAARMSGAVRFRRGRSEKLVTLAAGRPTLASSNLVEDRLVEGLYRTGRLPREAYERVRATIAGTGRRAGAILVEMGLLKREELVPVVRGHLEEVLFSVFGWEEGTWATEPETMDDAEHVRMEAPAAALILEGARLRYGPRRIERLLGGPSTVMQPRAGGLVPIEELRLLPEERGVLEACDGRRTLGEICAGGGTRLDDVGPALWALACLGFLEVSARGMPVEPAAVATPRREDLEQQIERRRVEERLAVARVGDYFALLGIAKAATGHEIRRAYLELSRAFDPGRYADPTLADLLGAAHEIQAALDDAYEVLRDAALRESYRGHLAE